MRYRAIIVSVLVLWSARAARPAVTLFLEEPFGTLGGMDPTGHAAIYLSHVCAASPLVLRPCHRGEQGAVISRYRNISGYDWIAIPLVPYLYAVDRPDQVPARVTPAEVAELRDDWRRQNLTRIAPDTEHGRAPAGDWIQLAGSAYDRTIYAFELPTTEAQDEKLIQTFNSRANKNRFHTLYSNCADFARNEIDFFYPHAIHRSIIADVGIMTPKEAARSLVAYSKRHRDVRLKMFVIPQVAGTVPRSRPVRGILESLVKSRRYALPLVSMAAVQPLVGGGLAFAWLEGSGFDPHRMEPSHFPSKPGAIAAELEAGE